ncbi:unnamed protein product [Effrenium voratum]|nr:unnamed protein product [Effrenium voratum]
MFWAQSCGFVAALAAEGFWQGFQSWPPVAAFCTMLAFFGLLFMFLTNVLSQFSRMDMAPLLAAAVTAGLFLLWSMTYFEAFADAPLLWFLKYILQVQNLRLLLLQWPTLLVVGVICVELLSQKLLHTNPSPKERHFVRKSFHGLAIVLFAPPLMSGQDEFLALSLLVATLLFIALEVGRCCGAPLSDVQNRYLAKFLDKREDITRDLVLTHLYLLLGCSLPVWLETWRPPSASSNLRKYAGLLLIGVGDSCAALFGILYGRLRWPSSHRTFVGSTAFAVSVTLAAAPLMAGWPYFALATAATTLLEVYTQSIDNLVLPLFFCAAYTARARQEDRTVTTPPVAAFKLELPSLLGRRALPQRAAEPLEVVCACSPEQQARRNSRAMVDSARYLTIDEKSGDEFIQDEGTFDVEKLQKLGVFETQGNRGHDPNKCQ